MFQVGEDPTVQFGFNENFQGFSNKIDKDLNLEGKDKQINIMKEYDFDSTVRKKNKF